MARRRGIYQAGQEFRPNQRRRLCQCCWGARLVRSPRLFNVSPTMGPTTGVWLLLRLLRFHFQVARIYLWGATFQVSWNLMGWKFSSTSEFMLSFLLYSCPIQAICLEGFFDSIDSLQGTITLLVQSFFHLELSPRLGCECPLVFLPILRIADIIRCYVLASSDRPWLSGLPGNQRWGRCKFLRHG